MLSFQINNISYSSIIRSLFMYNHFTPLPPQFSYPPHVHTYTTNPIMYHQCSPSDHLCGSFSISFLFFKFKTIIQSAIPSVYVCSIYIHFYNYTTPQSINQSINHFHDIPHALIISSTSNCTLYILLLPSTVYNYSTHVFFLHSSCPIHL